MSPSSRATSYIKLRTAPKDNFETLVLNLSNSYNAILYFYSTTFQTEKSQGTFEIIPYLRTNVLI